MNHLMGQFLIAPGEKFALIALPKVCVADSITQLSLQSDVFVTRHLPFSLEEHWQKWIGKIRLDQLNEAGFYIVAKLKSNSLEVLDSENQQLMQSVCLFLDSLLIVETPFCAARPFLLTGAVAEHETRVRQITDMLKPFRRVFNQAAILRELDEQDFERAANICGSLSSIINASTHIRLKRALSAFFMGIRETRFEESSSVLSLH